MNLSDVEWPSLWEVCTDRVLVEELQREVSLNHVLCNQEVNVIARRTDCDDVLFQEINRKYFALVHLTWSSKSENPPWPFTKIFVTFNEFAAENFDEQ